MLPKTTFSREFARSPKAIGSLTPSSRYLAEEVVRCAAIEPGQSIVELGAGTGAITRHLHRAFPDNPLKVLEPHAGLARRVRDELPEIDVIEAKAQQLPELLKDWGFSHIDRLVSSLPFASWNEKDQDEIFEAILECLAPDGRMVTFAYVISQVTPAAQRLKARLPTWFGSVERSRVIVRNLPPAFVYILSEPRRPVPSAELATTFDSATP